MKKALVLLIALFTVSLPATALAAPIEGSGSPLSVSPLPVVVPKTTVGNNGAALRLEITNPGEEAFVDKVTLEGEEAGEFFINGSDCTTLVEGGSCSFWFGLKPSSLGVKQASLVITFQGGRPAEAFTVSGESVPPALAFTPASHDFGIQRVNRETSTRQFQVTNTGEAPVQPNNFEIQGDTSAFWVGYSNCWSGPMLEPGQSCSVEANFNPHETVEYAAELRTWANGSVFAAALSGEGGRAIVGPSENPVDFGSAAIGSSFVETITLTNSGNLPGAFFIAVVAGGDVGSFRLLSENCTMVELAPADPCSARVRFEPQEPGPLGARLAMFGDGDDATMIFLKGEGLPATTASSQAAQDAVPASRKVRRKRFGRNRGIHAPSLRAARRSELRAGAARR